MKAKMSIALLGLMIAAGCSENDQVSLPQVPENAVPINIGQQVDAVTRAVAENGAVVSATILRCDGADASWTEFAKVDQNVINTGNLETRANVSVGTFIVGTETPVALNPALYYNTNNTTASHIAAVSPAGTMESRGTVVSFSTTDGTQDVMYAPTIGVGASTDAEAAHDLAFAHKTTQLNFKLKIQNAADNGKWTGKNVTLKSIKVQAAAVPQSVNASTGEVTWTTAASMPVPQISNLVLNTTSETTAGVPFMIKPNTSVMLDVAIAVGDESITFTNINVTKAGGIEPLATSEGKSHTITLTVKEPQTAAGAVEIVTTATVTPWEAGDSGKAEF